MLTYYEWVAPHLNEPLYTRPVRTVVGVVHPTSAYWRGWLLDCSQFLLCFYSSFLKFSIRQFNNFFW
jgi:hypothetical protein